MIYVKNTTVDVDVWEGQTIQPSEYYQLEPTEFSRWANSSKVISDIGIGKLVVAKTDDGTTDFTNISKAVDFIKGNLPQEVLLIPSGSIERRKYNSVAAFSSIILDYIVTNLKTLSLFQFGGNGAKSADIKVEIIWDALGTPDNLFSTHDAQTEYTLEKLIGDGVKVLRIKLTNDSAQSETMGAYWIGKEE